jgi:predicted alpha/beta hydrolase family esterase
MTDIRQVLFIQGGGEGTHDAWDDKLVDSLRAGLGAQYEVRYPRMPEDDDPGVETWIPAIRRELAALEDGAVVVGHSIGATLLVYALESAPPNRPLGGIVLLAAPFVGQGGWHDDDFEFTTETGRRLPVDVPVHVFFGLDDDTVPPAHAELWAAAIPQARLHPLPRGDHQLGNDLTDVARVIRALAN